MSMAREGRIRKLNRRDWPGFLNRMIPACVWQAFSQQVPAPADSRRRWSAKYVVLCWVMMAWSMEGLIATRFSEAGEVLSRLFWSRRRPGGSYQGLTKATERLAAGPLGRFWACLRQTFPRRLRHMWTWFGWVVIAVDGSRVDAPRTRRNEQGLGLAGRDKTHPQWWITLAVHLPTSVLWDWRQGPGRSSERTHLREMIPTLPASSLVVADAGFGGFDLLWELRRAGTHFLIRCASNTTLLIEGTAQQIEELGECRQVYLWPQNRRDRQPLCLRLIVLKRQGKRVYLLTSVLDPVRLSRDMAAKFYQARWGIEVAYRAFKQTLGHRRGLAKRPNRGPWSWPVTFWRSGC